MRVQASGGLGTASLLALGLLVGGARELRATPAARKTPRILVAVIIAPVSGVRARVRSGIERLLRKALRKNKRLRVVRVSRRFASFAGQLPRDALAEGRAAKKRGFALLESGNARAAITAFSKARAAQMRALAYVSKRSIAAVQLGQALAYYQSRLRGPAHRALMALLTWRPRVRVNLKAFPRGFRTLFARVRREVKRLPRSTFVLRSRPPGVKAYLDGHHLGKTPVEIDGVPIGTHYLTLKKHGYFRLTARVEVPKPPAKGEYEFALKQNEKSLLLDQALRRTWPSYGKPRASAAMLDIKTLLGLDQVVLVRPSPPGDDGIRLDACLYDLRTGNRLKRLSGTLPAPNLEAKTFARSLYAGVRYDGTLPDPGKEKVKVGPGRLPLWKRWWFWTAIGVAVAATVTGIAVPLSRQSDGPKVPAGYHTVSVRF